MMCPWLWGNWLYGYPMIWGWFGPILMISFWILVIIGIIFLVKAISWKVIHLFKEDTPIDILNKRYAKGEIEREEFIKMKKDLGY
jgi:putative membrane protein